MSRTTYPRNLSTASWMEWNDLADEGVHTRQNAWAYGEQTAPRARRNRFDDED